MGELLPIASIEKNGLKSIEECRLHQKVIIEPGDIVSICDKSTGYFYMKVTLVNYNYTYVFFGNKKTLRNMYQQTIPVENNTRILFYEDDNTIYLNAGSTTFLSIEVNSVNKHDVHVIKKYDKSIISSLTPFVPS